jgi:hypothetical protein
MAHGAQRVWKQAGYLQWQKLLIAQESIDTVSLLDVLKLVRSRTIALLKSYGY